MHFKCVYNIKKSMWCIAYSNIANFNKNTNLVYLKYTDDYLTAGIIHYNKTGFPVW